MLLYKIAEKVYELENSGVKVTKMNVGELDFPTPPEITEAGLKALKEGKTAYGSAAGEKDLREKIAEMHGVGAENVVVTPGSKWGIFSTLNLLCRDGKVLSLSPGWPAFQSMAAHFDASYEAMGLKMENNWKIDIDALAGMLKGKSLMILNNPCNPTSKAWSDEEEKKIVESARENGVPVVLDLAYRDLAFEKKADVQWEDGTIICNSFSKSLAMTGWRLGYIVADKELAQKHVKLNQISITCVPKFIQAAALAGLENRESITSRFRKECKERADAAMKTLKGKGMECTRPDAGFYVFPKLPCKDAFDACMKLLDEHGIATVPGSVFGEFPQHTRISLCYSPEIVEDALTKMVDVAEKCG